MILKLCEREGREEDAQLWRERAQLSETQLND
jgi:hypothetical protein